MADEQLKLLNGPDSGGPASPKTASQGGPVFDFGPGWGFYVRKWFGKYLFKIILPAIVIIVAVGIYTSSNETENDEKTIANNETIKIAVLRGDSRALLARKALAEYLKGNSQEMLTGGQKIFIEEMLRREIGGQKLVAGEEISFDLNSIKEAISQSKNLSPYQLQVWEGYAKGIKF